MSVLVKCCLNGPRGPEEHRAVPVDANAAAREAAAALGAGAGALHVHPRDGEGRESLEADAIAEWIAAIRLAAPGVPVGVSSGAWIEPDPDARARAIGGWRDPLPDFASINVGEDGAREVARACLRRGVAVEAGLWSAQDVARLATIELESPWLRLLVEGICEPAEQLARVSEIDDALDELGTSAARLYHGVGEATWDVIRQALARGRDVRVGLEDVLVLPDGSRAAGNGELVRAAWACA